MSHWVGATAHSLPHSGGSKPPWGAGPQPCRVPSPPKNDSVWGPDSHCRNGVWSPSGGFLDAVLAADAQAPFLQVQAQREQAGLFLSSKENGGSWGHTGSPREGQP